jgi:DNA-directed RNA polymerase sigma subunit (sigma70/sigma32)
MKTIDELIRELKLNPQQAQKVQEYMSELVIELLESIKEDNDNNFDETIDNLKNHTA